MLFWLDGLAPDTEPPLIDIDITDGSGDADVEQTESPVFVPRTPLLKQICGRMVTTVKATRSPDFRMRFTTVS